MEIEDRRWKNKEIREQQSNRAIERRELALARDSLRHNRQLRAIRFLGRREEGEI